MSKNKIKEAITGAAAIYLFADLLVKGLQFLVMPISSHVLELDEYAKFTIYLTLLTALAPLVNLSSQAAYSIFYNGKLGCDKLNLFSTTLQVSFTGLMVTIGLMTALASYNNYVLFPIVGVYPDIQLIAFVVFVESIITIYLVSRRLEFDKVSYFKWFTFYNLTKVIIGLLSMYVFGSAVYYLISLLFVYLTFAVYLIYREFTLKSFLVSLLTFNGDLYRRIITYSLTVIPVSLFAVLNSLIDKYYVSSLLTTGELASYTSMFLLAGSLQIVILAKNKAFMPALLKQYTDVGYDALDSMKRSAINSTVIISIFFFLFIVLLPYLFVFLFDSEITFNLLVFLLLSQSFLFNSLYIFYTNALSLEERTAKYRVFGFLSAILINIPLGYVLTSKYGLVGAALSTVLSNLIAVICLGVIVNALVKKRYLMKESLIVIIASTVLIFMISYCSDIWF